MFLISAHRLFLGCLSKCALQSHRLGLLDHFWTETALTLLMYWVWVILTRHQRLSRRIVMFPGVQLILVKLLLSLWHVSVRLRVLLDLNLSIEFVLVHFLHLFFLGLDPVVNLVVHVALVLRIALIRLPLRLDNALTRVFCRIHLTLQMDVVLLNHLRFKIVTQFINFSLTLFVQVVTG